MKWNDFKERLRQIFRLIFIDKIPFKWTVFKLCLSCLLWDLRGLQTCPYHGFNKQSYFTGYCKECGEIPKLPPIEDTCIFCGEEKAILQRASPNDDKEIWSLCWECDQHIEWGQVLSWCQQAESMGLKGKMVKPFDEWLFDKHQVYPKHEYNTIVFKKKKVIE